MKVVFLDIDGVLNTHPHQGSGLGLQKVPVINLEFLLKKVPDLKIVISSSWRIQGLQFLKDAFKEEGLDPRKITDIIGDELKDNKHHRGHQIECWLKRNPEVKKFVILDDSRDMEPHLDKLVRTNPMKGLTQDNVEEALKILE